MIPCAPALLLACGLALALHLPGNALAVGRVTAGTGGVAIGGDVAGSTITVGLTPKEVRALVDQILGEAGIDAMKIAGLATDFGVTDGAVRTFLRTLGEEQVPIEALPETLGRIAERHKYLLAQIEQVRSSSPDVQAIKEQAAQAVEAGAYDRAEELLTKAEDAALADANRLLLDAAALRAERGQLALTRLQYATAAGHFAAAADMVPRSEPLLRAEYLHRAGEAGYFAADYAAAEAHVKEALAFREKDSAPGDPALATSLNGLAELYRVTGRYAEAEPLYQRAIATDEKALGPAHPDLARNLNNLASL